MGGAGRRVGGLDPGGAGRGDGQGIKGQEGELFGVANLLRLQVTPPPPQPPPQPP